MKNIIYIIITIILAFIFSYLIYNKYYFVKDFKKIDLSNANNLMIVAHPDDEMLWGGAHLLNGNYLVVCITCGRSNTRDKEFKEVMELTNNKYIMLGYPDKVLGIRSDWINSWDNINNDIHNILSLKNWNLVVTHNSKGEYGHEHHILTNKAVLSNIKDFNYPLYNFGTYYSKKSLDKKGDNIGEEIDEYTLSKKITILEKYKSQDFILDSFGHMLKYENWVMIDYEKDK